MKRLTAGLAAGVFVLGFSAGAEARDLQGRWGLGVSTVFGARGISGGQPTALTGGGVVPAGLTQPGLSIKYQLNDNWIVNPGFGVAYVAVAGNENADPEGVAEYTLGARAAYLALQEGNANFYVGSGVILNTRSASDGANYGKGKLIRIPATFGVDLFFSKSSSFAIHVEGGVELGLLMPEGDMAQNVTTFNTVGGVFNIGFHWYFAASGEDEEEE